MQEEGPHGGRTGTRLEGRGRFPGGFLPAHSSHSAPLPTSHSALPPLSSAEEWLELWWLGMSRGPRAAEPQWQVFKAEAWYQVVSMLCRVIKNPHLEVRRGGQGECVFPPPS